MIQWAHTGKLSVEKQISQFFKNIIINQDLRGRKPSAVTFKKRYERKLEWDNSARRIKSRRASRVSCLEPAYSSVRAVMHARCFFHRALIEVLCMRRWRCSV